ncbi:MAG: 23S rRNA (pseudouridine(1915)-N(3))-methyltransferase RlmH [Magnetococcales bacterium]|nr:23S rRNA (pseudouridine(1915)-N(3))-methyltransferase RlmH [Magnetococcales bacterium]
MKLNIVAVGRGMPKPVAELVEDYRGRMRRSGGVKLIEIAEERRRGDGDANRRMALQKEAGRIKAKLPGRGLLVPLFSGGKVFTSEAFSGQLSRWQDAGEPQATFMIGGPDGLDDSILKMGRITLSFGPMTLPHMLVRVVLLEQLYRAMTIQKGIPYHR